MEPLKKLGNAELLITKKGTIYHLDIAPEHLADTVITVGDPERVQSISAYFDRITHKSQHREFVCHTGYLGSKHITVVSTGIGPGNIDIVLNELDALANIDFSTGTTKPLLKKLSIIRLGTCGALRKEIDTGSMVVSSYGVGLDNLLHYYKYRNNADETFIIDELMQHTRLEGSKIQPYIAEGAITLRKHFARDYLHGITATCPGFYAPQGRNLRTDQVYPYLMDALSTFSSRELPVANFEMETAAIYGLGKVLGHNCCSISTVVNNRITNAVSTDMGKDVNNMIRHSLAIIEQIP